MAVYVPTGKLGSGKSLWAVSKMREAMENGRPVATNMDLFPDHLPRLKAPVFRVPDFPTAADLAAIGEGGPSRDEEQWGWLVLDEAGAWLNARAWGDKGRDGVISWLLHARKHHWNVILLIQGLGMLDKQVRDSLVEYNVVCRRTDRLNIPIVGKLLHTMSLGKFSGRLPKAHMAQVKYGIGPTAMHVQNDWYRGHDLYPMYDTDQKLSSLYQHGLYSLWQAPEKLPEVATVPLKPKDRIAQLLALIPDPDERMALAARYLRARERACVSTPVLAG